MGSSSERFPLFILSNTFTKIYPISTTKYERQNRIAPGHIQTVQYINSASRHLSESQNYEKKSAQFAISMSSPDIRRVFSSCIIT